MSKNIEMSEFAQRWIDIHTGDGTMDALLVLPEGKPKLGIVLLQEIFGINSFVRGEAQALAARGYAVLAPDLFWRQERRVSLDYTPEGVGRAMAFRQQLNPAHTVPDVVCTAKAFAAMPESGGRVALIGFCLGGKLAVMAGARFPEAAAVISFYGVALEQDLVAFDAISAPVQLHVGDSDRHVPLPATEQVIAHNAGRDNIAVHIYPGMDHAFFNPLRSDVFNADAANTARARVDALLAACKG